MTKSEWVKVIIKALLRTGRGVGQDLLLSVVQSNAKKLILPKAVVPKSRLVSARWYPRRSVDGATLGDFAPNPAYAKYAIPKGLPVAGTRSLAIENDPHEITGFSGVIPEGYGKGTKTLIDDRTVIVKIGRRSFPARMNYHEHDADKAGLHHDLVVEGVPEGTKQWEMNIPSGPFKGRFAFVTTPKGKIIVPMKDEGIVIPKPNYILKSREWLEKIDPNEYDIEQKYDGSLANTVIGENRAAFRSHREVGSTYYDKIPQLEYLWNTSRLYSSRLLFPSPNQDGTVLTVELFHKEGPGRMGGILNAYPDKSRQIQKLRGNAELYAWEILKYKGKDVSKLPHHERRMLLEKVVKDIRIFNKHWHVANKMDDGKDPVKFYDSVISQPLPYGEGVVVKSRDNPSGGIWYKVKQTDFSDLILEEVMEGTGKYFGSAGKLVVKNPENGAIGEVGSFGVTNEERQWIWDNREQLKGSIVKVKVQEMTERGAPRAGVFMEFHEGKGSEAGLLMYAETLAGGDPVESKRMLYRLKSSAGWKK